MVLISWNKYGEDECLKVKEAEILKFIDFDVYHEVVDVEQACISTIWAMTNKKGQVKALVAVVVIKEWKSLNYMI